MRIRLTTLVAAVAVCVIDMGKAPAQTEILEGPSCCLHPLEATCDIAALGDCVSAAGIGVPGVLCCALPPIADTCTGGACYSGPTGTEGIGACQAGTFECAEDGIACVGEVTPTTETCNGIDDDCDGQTDEDFAVDTACDGPDSDLCAEGVMVCDASGDVTCSDSTADNTEVCNGIDDDCNGVADEGCPSCTPGDVCNVVGQCVSIFDSACTCVVVVGPEPETCDGIDNNCDGVVDEGCP